MRRHLSKYKIRVGRKDDNESGTERAERQRIFQDNILIEHKTVYQEEIRVGRRTESVSVCDTCRA